MIKLYNILVEHLNSNDFNLKDVNLQNEYDYWNKKLFNNELPKIPLKFNSRKTSGGVVDATVFKSKYKYEQPKLSKIKSLQISTYFIHNYNRFHGILIHEMIHVKLFNDGIIYTRGTDKSHGYEFEKIRKELNSKVDFDIPKSENPSDLIINTDVVKHKKEFDVLIFDIRNKKYILVFKLGSLKANDIIDKFKSHLNHLKNDSIRWYKSDLIELNKYTIKSKFAKKDSYSVPTPEILNVLDKQKPIMIFNHETI